MKILFTGGSSFTGYWFIEELARAAMAELTRLTGRPLSFVDTFHLDNAEAVLVAQGAAVQVAKAVADHLRRTRRWKLGVLGLTWLRPLPARELVDALKGHRSVAVLEPLDDPLAPEPRLFRELKGLMGGAEGWISATYANGDPDPARLYGVETRRLNEQVRRNKERFPEDFMFQLTAEESEFLRSHFAISKPGRGGRRSRPRASTEHGALMAANVLETRRAIEASR